jgi:hypothetical protein
MTDTTIVAVPPGPPPSYVEWAPIVGGALIASALSFVLFSFGSAAGVASVSPYSWNNPSTTILSLIAVAWFVIVMIGSFLVGGYFAGRFRTPIELRSAEREIRDGAHGLLVWALGLAVGLALAFISAGVAAHTAATAAGPAAAVAAQRVSGDPLGGIVDGVLRPAQPRPNDDPRAEITRVMGKSFSRGEITNEDRTYLARLVAARAGIPEDEARRRVDTAIEQAKQAADRARKMAAILAFLIGAASLFAAGAAYWAATLGGQHRDERVRA